MSYEQCAYSAALFESQSLSRYIEELAKHIKHFTDEESDIVNNMEMYILYQIPLCKSGSYGNISKSYTDFIIQHMEKLWFF